MSRDFYLADEHATDQLGRRLSAVTPATGVIYLSGDLGAGKSTLARGFIRALGVTSAIKSPTYTLVEHYALPGRDIYHLDLYRLSDPEELEFIGIRDLLSENSLCLIEWPEKAAGVLAPADLHIELRTSNDARQIKLTALNPSWRRIIKEL